MKSRRRRIGTPRRLDIIGLAWFDDETHARMQEVLLQPHDIPWNYVRWREKAENEEHIWKRTGLHVARIAVDPDTFLEWCAARGLDPNGEALKRYIHERTVGPARPLFFSR